MFENEQKYFKTNNIWLFSNMTTAFKHSFCIYANDFQCIFCVCYRACYAGDGLILEKAAAHLSPE